MRGRGWTAFLLIALASCGRGEEPKVATLVPSPPAGEPRIGATQDGNVFDAALRFSGCMRDHGVDVADPEVGGEGGLAFVISQRNLDDPDFTAAEDACGHLLPPGSLAPNLSPEEEVRQYDQAVRYARCMRERGIDLPDPEPAGSVIGLAPGTDPGDPEFVAAHEVCGVHLRDVQPAP